MRITPCHNWKQTHINTDGLDELVRNILNSQRTFKIYRYLHSSRFSEGYVYDIGTQELQNRMGITYENTVEGIERLKNHGFLAPIKDEDDDDEHYFFYEMPLDYGKKKSENSITKQLECIWIPGYENLYAVTCNGMVFTERKQRILIPIENEKGERCVALKKDGEEEKRITIAELQTIAKAGGLKW